MQVIEFMTYFLDSLFKILTFEIFITPSILLIIYYIGFVLLPIILYQYLYKRVYPLFKNVSKQRYLTWVLIVLVIVFELCWRMLIEFMMAYFQIRDALLSIAA